MTEKLVQAGYQLDEPTAFAVEGLTIYLTEEDVAELFSRLADLGTTGSRLAVSFESGFERQRVLRLVTRAYYGRVGETLRLPPATGMQRQSSPRQVGRSTPC
ncbi:MAG TPA: class I SAM-dependent methyltransferase [Acidimicrobiales bacterium]|nr:class I SAM-dependent methyltransferase [Acidimicrobiales bacterium]